VPGVHADVGGGYGVEPVEETDRVEERRINYHRAGPASAWQPGMLRRKEALREEARRRGLVLQYDRSEQLGSGEVVDCYWLVRKRTVRPGLSNVYLHVMYSRGIEHSVPFVPRDRFQEMAQDAPQRFAIAPELKALFQPDLITPRDDETLRREYIHQSHVDREDSTPGRRWVAHYPDPSGRRRVFYNEPDKAVVPGKKQKTKAQ